MARSQEKSRSAACCHGDHCGWCCCWLCSRKPRNHHLPCPIQPISVFPRICRQQMCEELVRQNFLTFARIKFVDHELSNINQFVCVTAYTGRNFWQTIRKLSLHTWGPQPWLTNFAKENGFNHVFIRHFSSRSCSSSFSRL